MSVDLFKPGEIIPPERTAIFSPCRVWRYRLEIRWNAGPALIFLMLNPSTADELKNDPTVERCERYARRNKTDAGEDFGAIIILNLFAFRATEPDDMKAADDPIGAENDKIIMETLASVRDSGGELICAWGTHGATLGRDVDVIMLISDMGLRPKALRLTKHGYPNHPLYLPNALVARWWSDMELERSEAAHD